MKSTLMVAATSALLLLLGAGVAAATPVAGTPESGFSTQTVIFVVLGFLGLIIVSALGPLSRMHEHREERRLEAAEAELAAKSTVASGVAETGSLSAGDAPVGAAQTSETAGGADH
ncbi:hypothetical protein EH165_00740 [Nakamurella antarctica]|uniref:Uncharacterized protein n=1 Tax=Nakamurella antarctica TaxID=1902245 RepID=A0A3G8ZI05_9ACTN|nr:hypothetical protein [Nakamurella antarctica]AZI56913.1 hypothetical protein EH165_00740 [Nakamurella antarctica]